MKPALLFLLFAMAMTACSTLSREEIAAYNDPKVPAPVAERMQHGGKLSLADVVDLSRIGMRSSEIITYLSWSRSEFNLSQQDVENLRQEGVSGDVITCMREKPDAAGGFFGWF